MNKNRKILHYISKLEPQEFIGLTKLLKVKLLGENNEPLPFSEVLEKTLDSFSKASKIRQKEILFLLREATKEEKGEKINGSKD